MNKLPNNELIIFSLLIGAISALGVFFNISAIFTIRTLPRFNNAFGALTIFKAFCDAGVGAVFVFWIVPTSFFGGPDRLHYVNAKMGQFSLFCQTAAYHAMLFISLNRYMAISHPFTYRSYFTTNRAFIIIFIVVLLSISYASIFFFDSCEYFVSDDLKFGFSTSPCGQFVAFYVDLIYSFALFSIILTIDFSTVMRMRYTRTHGVVNNKHDTKTKERLAKQARKEAVLVVQACVSSALYCIGLVNMHIVALFTTSVEAIFLTTTFSFGLAHAAEGLILILFYSDLRKKLFRCIYFCESVELTSSSSANIMILSASTERLNK